MKNKLLLWFGIILIGGSLLTGCGANVELVPGNGSEEAGAGQNIAETAGQQEETADMETADQDDKLAGVHVLQMNGDSASLDGATLESYDYTWHIDPSKEKEWYEGSEPATEAAAYIARDIMYYPVLEEEGFTLQKYDGENEWVYHYTAEGLEEYLFSTLPNLGEKLPVEMMHTAEEAYANLVLHITKPGTYMLTGQWHGQIYVDLGEEEETFQSPEAKVHIILNNAEVTCDVAPAIVFDDLYECDYAWAEREKYSNEVDTTEAGVVVTIASGSENHFTGANIYRLLKPQYKKDSTSVQKKAHKMDGAFYSFVSMVIEGDASGSGVLNITSTTYEGLNSELHLTINGGNINIYSQDDGINVNEDKVSVFTMNGGTLHIFAGLGAEGDGVDSNGYIVVNGGLIAGGTPSGSDELLDSDCGNTVNGGEVIVIGSGKGAGGMRGGFMPGGREAGEDFIPGDRKPGEDFVPGDWKPGENFGPGDGETDEDFVPGGWKSKGENRTEGRKADGNVESDDGTPGDEAPDAGAPDMGRKELPGQSEESKLPETI